MVALRRIRAENFLSLREVDVTLGPLNVLVGPNGAGKTNLLNVIRFLGDTARQDLVNAVGRFGGFSGILFRGKRNNNTISLLVEAEVTRNASYRAPDAYTLKLRSGPKPRSRDGKPDRPSLVREEMFTFKRTRGPGKRITIAGANISVAVASDKESSEKPGPSLSIDQESSGLSTLQRLGQDMGAPQVKELASIFETFRVFDVNVEVARLPSPEMSAKRLKDNSSNLASFLVYLSEEHPETFECVMDDMRHIMPGFRSLHFVRLGGAAAGVAIEIEELALTGRTPLGRASFGTIRALALLAMLHDPDPPMLTCVEEIDHGLHPYALDRIIDRLREASARTQFLVATHSPTLVNRLEASELIVCERDAETGASRIPAFDSKLIPGMEEASGLRPGELWFSGTLGGVI